MLEPLMKNAPIQLIKTTTIQSILAIVKDIK